MSKCVSFIEVQVSKTEYLVVGGGPAGWSAAVQIARGGGRVLLVEKSGMLGGTTTLNGINLPGLFHAWGRQVIAGCGRDLAEVDPAEIRDLLRSFGAITPDLN
jgi:NADPH-dependent 2,4-dienoyl-CoA reductase/sulfur reductase-like enzyme